MFVYCYQFICKFYFPEINKNKNENIYFLFKVFPETYQKSKRGSYIIF